MTTASARVAAGLLVGMLVPAIANAQTSETPCSQPTGARETCEAPGFAERWTAVYRTLHLKGLTPGLGPNVPGSGFRLGLEARRDRMVGLPVGASVDLMWSVRGYHEYTLRVGSIRGDHYRTALNSLGTNVSSTFSDGAHLAPGVSAYFEAQQRVYPRVDFFGLGQQATVNDRTDYGFRGSTRDAVVQWQHNRHFGAALRVGVSHLRIEEGRNKDVPNLETRYAPDVLPGLTDQPRYRAIGLATVLDYRDRASVPSGGSWIGVALWKATPRDPALRGGFTRLVTDVRHFRSLPDQKHVLALRALISTELGRQTLADPFYLQPALGGSKTMRGLASYRLRGNAVWTATAEYRWHVQRFIELAPFVDIGAVASGAGALSNTGPTVTPGIGVRMRTSDSVLARVDFAGGRDGRRIIVTLGAPF